MSMYLIAFNSIHLLLFIGWLFYGAFWMEPMYFKVNLAVSNNEELETSRSSVELGIAYK